MTGTHQKRRSSLIIMQKCLVLASAVSVTLNQTWVNNPQQGLNHSIEPNQYSIQITTCLSILYYNTKEGASKDITRLKSENIVIQLGYNAIALHENILLS
jgi:hypothetical protein